MLAHRVWFAWNDALRPIENGKHFAIQCEGAVLQRHQERFEIDGVAGNNASSLLESIISSDVPLFHAALYTLYIVI